MGRKANRMSRKKKNLQRLKARRNWPLFAEVENKLGKYNIRRMNLSERISLTKSVLNQYEGDHFVNDPIGTLAVLTIVCRMLNLSEFSHFGDLIKRL